MEDKSKLGTVIHGIAASEHIDSSGEILSIEGMDISSLGAADSIFNFEHNSKENPAQVVGKVTFAKKIFKKSDCSNEHEEHFWEFCKKPFVYIKGELFDHPDLDHDGARNVAALLRYDNRDKGEKSRHLISFSIEGGKMDKKGMVVTKSIARDVAITIKHCNRMCIVEIFDDIKQRKDLYKHQNEVANLLKTDVTKHGFRNAILEDMKKNLSNMNSFADKIATIKQSSSLKQKTKASSQLGNMSAQPPGQEFAARPKRQFIDSKAPSNLKVGDKVTHTSKTGIPGSKLYKDPNTFAKEPAAPSQPKQPNPGLKTGISGKDLYNNPDTFKPEAPQQKPKLTPTSKPKTGADIYRDKSTWTPENNMRKALVAGVMSGSPDSKTGMAALSPESIEPTLQKPFEENKKKKLKKKENELEPLQKMSQPRLKFPKVGADSDPRMDVKHVDPNKTFTTKEGKTYNQLDLERKKLENKYRQGVKSNLKNPADATKLAQDKNYRKNIDTRAKNVAQGLEATSVEDDKTYVTHGQHISDPRGNINENYTFSSSPNLRTTQHHEALHGTLSKLRSHPKVGNRKTDALINYMLDSHFNSDDLHLVSKFVTDRGYSPKDREEHLTHVLDLLSNPKKRKDFAKFVAKQQPGGYDKELGSQQIIHQDIMSRLKQGWKNTVGFANNLDLDTVNRLFRKPSKNKKIAKKQE
jgi:hypothetical protein